MIDLDSESCAPGDAFWQANRDFAERLWKRRDGATVSTRVAEHISATTNVPVPAAKTGVHGVASTAVGVWLGKATGSPIIGVLAGLALFAYLERDRC
jgi:hypothetical protein